jgi:hypothetical protein
MCENQTEQSSAYQPPLDLGEKTVDAISITKTTKTASDRQLRNPDKQYPCEDPARTVKGSAEHLRPKQELSYLFNEIIRARNLSNYTNRKIPPLKDDDSALQYCKNIIRKNTYQPTLDINNRPQDRIEKLEQYFKDQPNLEISLVNFITWLQTQEFIIDSVHIPGFVIKEKELRVRRGICDAIQIIPKDLLHYNTAKLHEIVYHAQTNRPSAPSLIDVLNGVGKIYVFEFKIGDPKNYTRKIKKTHLRQIDNYIHRIHELTGIKVIGRLIYFSDREGNGIYEEIRNIRGNYWDEIETVVI